MIKSNPTKAILRNKSKGHCNLRTPEITGMFFFKPEVGKQFCFTASPLEEGFNFRVVATSIVKKIKSNKNIILFYTENSIYELETLEGE